MKIVLFVFDSSSVEKNMYRIVRHDTTTIFCLKLRKFSSCHKYLTTRMISKKSLRTGSGGIDLFLLILFYGFVFGQQTKKKLETLTQSRTKTISNKTDNVQPAIEKSPHGHAFRLYLWNSSVCPNKHHSTYRHYILNFVFFTMIFKSLAYFHFFKR